ncbi:hypothetical protein [Streptomyces violascens]|uniref:hypothetical protein n=1 Tax=Streptomyces violascens TaxID=67381 RepID=UPI00167BF100|nr:hypothetical protein [Streptomyces violascens]GGU29661.1 hypothetical protein GCM10010289_58780 [Streptomyces violascens]
MYETKVRLVDSLGEAPGSYELKVIPLNSATVAYVTSGAGYTVLPLELGQRMPEGDVQIVVRARTGSAPVVGQGVLRLRWSRQRRSVNISESDDFPPHLHVVADGRGA